MYVRIYRQRKVSTQSGNRKHKWIVEALPAPERTYYIDPVMHWNGSRDTSKQIILSFDDRLSAMEYAKANNMTILDIQPDDINLPMQKKSYLANFE